MKDQLCSVRLNLDAHDDAFLEARYPRASLERKKSVACMRGRHWMSREQEIPIGTMKLATVLSMGGKDSPKTLVSGRWVTENEVMSDWMDGAC